MTKKRGLNQGRVDMLLSEALGLQMPLATGAQMQSTATESHPKKTVLAENVAQSAAKNIPATTADSSQAILQQIALEKLTPGQFQPRRVMQDDVLQELAASIKQQGVLQPLVARAIGSKFEIIAGERRWRSAGLAGLKTVPVIVRDISDQEAMLIGLVENMQRENLNPLEEAVALERLIKEFGFTHEETATRVGKSRAVISNLLRLLLLNKDVKNMLEAGSIDLGHAKVLLALAGKEQSRVAKIVVEKNLSVRDTERLIKQAVHGKGEKSQQERPLDPDIARLQRSLAEKVGSPVRILHTIKGKGKIVIKYNSIDELDGILEHIN